MSKTATWIIVIIVFILAIVFFVLNRQSGDTTTDDQNTTTDVGSQNGTATTSDSTTGVSAGVGVTLNSNKVTFNVEGSSFKFTPNKIEVKKGDTVEIIFKNSGGFHDFVIDEFNVRTSQLQSGKTETVTFVADKAGSFEYYCSVGTHRQMGMVGTLVVTE